MADGLVREDPKEFRDRLNIGEEIAKAREALDRPSLTHRPYDYFKQVRDQAAKKALEHLVRKSKEAKDTADRFTHE